MCSYSIRVGFNSWRTNFVQPLSLVSDDKDIFYSIQIYFITFCLLLKPVIVLQSFFFFFFIFGELYIIGWLIMWTFSIGIGFLLFCFPQLLLRVFISTDSCIFLSGGRALSSSFSFCLCPWGVRPKYVETEISIMRKLSHHKNILQLLDWNTAEGEAPSHTQSDAHG